MIRRTLIFISLLLLPLPAAAPALAHAMLEQQSPGAGAVLAAPPSFVHLFFSEKLEPSLSGASVTGAAGRSFAAKAPEIDGQVIMLRLMKLPPGKYHVSWHAVSVDTHRTEGGYDFTVAR